MYRKLTNLYTNPTKLSILLLITEYEKITVTQMAEYVDVSRANLYHYVSQMVEDGILNEPEVKVKKNYVEKYYTLNLELFGKFDIKAWEAHLSTLSADELRDLIGSSLTAQSIFLKIIADRIARAEPEQIDRIREMLLDGRAWFSYSVLSRENADRVKEYISKIIEIFSEPGTPEENEQDLTRLLLVFLPLLRGEKI